MCSNIGGTCRLACASNEKKSKEAKKKCTDRGYMCCLVPPTAPAVTTEVIRFEYVLPGKITKLTNHTPVCPRYKKKNQFFEYPSFTTAFEYSDTFISLMQIWIFQRCAAILEALVD